MLRCPVMTQNGHLAGSSLRGGSENTIVKFVRALGRRGTIPVPFALGFQIYPWVERLLRVRQYPLAAYGFALAMVALAVFMRWLVGEYTGAQIPFITFYPAIIIAALIGGLGPGILATVLSSVAAWYFFIPSHLAWPGQREIVELLLFAVISGMDVAIAVVLTWLIERLVLQHRNIRILLESAPTGLVLVDDRGTIKLVNASAEKLFGYSREELVGKAVEALVPPQHVSDHRKLRASYQEKPEVRLMGLGYDLSGRRRDGSEFPVEIGLNPVGRDGTPAILATVMDISARKKAEEHQRLIIGELEHRTRNLFAVVQAVITSSLKDAETIAEAGYVLSGRVKALSQAYVLLAEAAWVGASLGKILGGQVLLDPKRVTVDGCDIIITPRAAQQFAMIVHELATNAVKYGALSVPDGRVLISGKIDQYDGARSFVFSWKETGGPRVAQPTRRGFGSTILLEGAEQFGTVTMKYLPDGLIYQLHLDLKAIEVLKNVPTVPNKLNVVARENV
jgi:PAS domain S-box-containing protein